MPFCFKRQKWCQINISTQYVDYVVQGRHRLLNATLTSSTDNQLKAQIRDHHVYAVYFFYQIRNQQTAETVPLAIFMLLEFNLSLNSTHSNNNSNTLFHIYFLFLWNK